MEPTFPLIRLPENVILEVIKNFGMNRLLEFSLISTKTRDIVTSLGITAQAVRITISRIVGVTVSCENFIMILAFYKGLQDPLIHLDSAQPISAYFSNYYNRTVRSSTLFSFNNWLDHIKTVFCYNKPPNIDFWTGNERFEMESLKNAIKTVNHLSLTVENTEFRMKEIWENFKNVNELTLGSHPFEEACEVQKYFIQNFKSIEFVYGVSLDDMLMINSETVEFTRPIPQKQFNQFLKHWIRGSNPRLQCMFLSFDETDILVNGEVFLGGIDCKEMSKESKNEIYPYHEFDSDYIVEIRRNDGTTAVITTKYGVASNHIRFNVL